MRTRFACALLFLSAAVLGWAQTTIPPAPAAAGNPAGALPLVHYAGPGVAAPELIPFAAPAGVSGHCKKFDGIAELFMVVDSQGVPRQFFFLRALGNELDRMLLNIANADRFKPGTADGTPAAVGVSDEIAVHACVEEKKDASGKKGAYLRIRSSPEQKFTVMDGPVKVPVFPGHGPQGPRLESTPPGVEHVGGEVSAPRVLNNVEARFSDKGRREKISGICMITLIVDAHGMPDHPEVKKSLEPSMDEKALEAVNQYRFTPAMRKGEPVPVMITVEVNFRLY